MVYVTSTSDSCVAVMLHYCSLHTSTSITTGLNTSATGLHCTVLYSAAGRDDLQILLTTHVAQACASPALTCLIQILLSHCALP